MYLIKLETTPPEAGRSRYLTRDITWSFNRKVAHRFKAKEVIPIYQEFYAYFRTSCYSIELERVED